VQARRQAPRNNYFSGSFTIVIIGESHAELFQNQLRDEDSEGSHVLFWKRKEELKIYIES